MVRPKATQCPRGHLYNYRNTYLDPRECKRCRACRRLGMRKLRKSRTTRPIQPSRGCYVVSRSSCGTHVRLPA